MSDTVRLGIDVVAGLVPGMPLEEYTRRWFLGSEEWNAASENAMEQARILADLNGKAQAWAAYLMFQPDRVNWVKTEWVWF